MKYTYCLVFMLYACVSWAGAQKVHPLSVGSSMPVVSLTHIVNAPYTKAKLTYPKNKIVLLDFFATWCGSCINALPHLDSLQKQLGDSLEIWVVMQQSATSARALLKTNPKLRSLRLPIITGDSLLGSLFPHRLLPHEVWIQDGKVKAITLPDLVTVANIRTMLKGLPVHLPLKQDILDFDRNIPLLENGNGGSTSDILYKSMITRELKGVGSMQGLGKEANSQRHYFINRPLLNLYQFAYGFPFNRLIIETKDSLAYKDAHGRYLLFSYEITAPALTSETVIKKWMADDLNKLGKVYGSMQQRQTLCFVIARTTDSILCKTRGGKTQVQKDTSGNNMVYTNVPLTRIINDYTPSFKPTANIPIIIDETGIKSNIDLMIPVSVLKDITRLNKALEPYGLSVKKEVRGIDMFVLGDK